MGRLDFLDEDLADLERAHLLRTPRSHGELPAGAVWLCSNDYLALAERDTEARGAGGAGASALVWGYGPEHERAEAALARYAGVESCLLFSSGYAANVGAVSALAGPGDLVVSDALNHASLIDGCRLSGARVMVIPHLDLDALAEALRGAGRRRFFVTESYFSMDGDGPDLAAVAGCCERAGAVLVVDEAHAFGVLGPQGRGRCAEAGVVPDVVIGTLGKAFGLSGAFVGGTRASRTWLWNRARSFVFSTAMPPALARAAAQRVAEVEGADDARTRVLGLAARFREGLARETGRVPAGFGPIVPVAVGEPNATVAVAARLLREGFVVQPMRPPTVPAGSSRLRLTVRASLDAETVARAARAIGLALDELGSGSGRSARGRAPRPMVVAVLGTGTEVGKTHLGAALVRHLVAHGMRVAGRKPVESGVDGETGPDQGALEVVGSVLPASPAPYRFRVPVSPHLAARAEGVEIDVRSAVAWALAPAADGGAIDIVLVETAGGVLSPLGPGRTNLDLVAALEPDAVILVGIDRLGVLHEVGACRLALESRRLWSRCTVALSAPPVADASSGSNAAELVSLGVAPVVVGWARGADHAPETWTGVLSRSSTPQRST